MSASLNIIINDSETFATGHSNDIYVYDFQIKRALSEKGYSVRVLDIIPSKKGGYEWTAEIKKRNPMIVTEKEYSKITNCGGDLLPVRFSVEEAQEILINHGYELIVHYGKSEIEQRYSEPGTGEVRPTGRKYVEDRARILAVKGDQKNNLPEWNTSHAAYLLDFQTVFNNLLKSKMTEKSNDELLKRVEALEYKLNKTIDDEWTRNVEANERR